MKEGSNNQEALKAIFIVICYLGKYIVDLSNFGSFVSIVILLNECIYQMYIEWSYNKAQYDHIVNIPSK
jgi:hypothetical protein